MCFLSSSTTHIDSYAIIITVLPPHLRGSTTSIPRTLARLLLGGLIKGARRVGREALELGAGVWVVAGALLVRVLRGRVGALLAVLALGLGGLAAGVGGGHCDCLLVGVAVKGC